jgi:hypothetical protein
MPRSAPPSPETPTEQAAARLVVEETETRAIDPDEPHSGPSARLGQAARFESGSGMAMEVEQSSACRVSVLGVAEPSSIAGARDALVGSNPALSIPLSRPASEASGPPPTYAAAHVPRRPRSRPVSPSARRRRIGPVSAYSVCFAGCQPRGRGPRPAGRPSARRRGWWLAVEEPRIAEELVRHASKLTHRRRGTGGVSGRAFSSWWRRTVRGAPCSRRGRRGTRRTGRQDVRR